MSETSNNNLENELIKLVDELSKMSKESFNRKVNRNLHNEDEAKWVDGRNRGKADGLGFAANRLKNLLIWFGVKDADSQQPE